MTKQYSNLDTALAYAEQGIPVFPCNPSKKSPATKQGFKDATTDEAQIRKWWNKNPKYLIGSPNEASAFVVDVDSYKEPVAETLINVMKKDLGFSTGVPVTTKSGGTHLYFQNDPSYKRRTNALTGIDFCGAGGYTCLPDGHVYKTQGQTLKSFIKSMGARSLPRAPELVDTYYSQEKRDMNALLADSDSEAMRMYGQMMTNAIVNDTYRKEYKKSTKAGKNEAVKKAIMEKEEAYTNQNLRSRPENMKVFDAPTTAVKDENGKWVLKKNSMDMDGHNSLIYTRELQIAMAKHLGCLTPSPGARKSARFHSVMYKRVDNKASMGTRWALDGCKLLSRDFANPMNEEDWAIDKDMTALYIHLHESRAKDKMMRVGKISFSKQFPYTMKLLDEAGLATFPDAKAQDIREKLNQFDMDPAYRSFLVDVSYLLDMKDVFMHNKRETTLSYRFIEAWSCLTRHMAQKFVKQALKDGFLVKAGTHGDGLLSTAIYQPAFEEMSIEELAEKYKPRQRTLEEVATERKEQAKKPAQKNAQKSAKVDQNNAQKNVESKKAFRDVMKEDYQDRVVAVFELQEKAVNDRFFNMQRDKHKPKLTKDLKQETGIKYVDDYREYLCIEKTMDKYEQQLEELLYRFTEDEQDEIVLRAGLAFKEKHGMTAPFLRDKEQLGAYRGMKKDLDRHNFPRGAILERKYRVDPTKPEFHPLDVKTVKNPFVGQPKTNVTNPFATKQLGKQKRPVKEHTYKGSGVFDVRRHVIETGPDPVNIQLNKILSEQKKHGS